MPERWTNLVWKLFLLQIPNCCWRNRKTSSKRRQKVLPADDMELCLGTVSVDGFLAHFSEFTSPQLHSRRWQRRRCRSRCCCHRKDENRLESTTLRKVGDAEPSGNINKPRRIRAKTKKLKESNVQPVDSAARKVVKTIHTRRQSGKARKQRRKGYTK